MKDVRREAGRGVCSPASAAGMGLALLPLARPDVDFGQVWLHALIGILALAAAVFAVAWWTHRKSTATVQIQLQHAWEQARAREKERDTAQGELLLRLEQERELNKQKMQLQAQLADYEKSAALAQMALGAAHEINNPLLGILSHLELELKSAGPEARVEIEQCIESAKRITATTRGLLNYARPDPMRASRIQLSRLLGELLAFLGHQPMLRALRVENRIAANLPAIYADSQQLSQVLTNVLLNAAQATPAGGSITIEGEPIPASGMLEIRVVDTGSGIPADILPHVFEPFFTTKRGRGTGLGLSISQAYVRLHGGDIRVESKEGSGTTVRITLPVGGEVTSVQQETTEVVA